MEPTIIFTHIPKTAGTSCFESVIKPNYSDEEIAVCRGMRSLHSAWRTQPKIIVAHTSYGIHRAVRGPSVYLTFLREPVDRVISFYYFIRQCKYDDYEHPLWREASGSSLLEFCRNRRFRNVQTRSLAGVCMFRAYARVRSRIFDRVIFSMAVRHMTSRYHVGLKEQFDESVSRMRTAFGWKDSLPPGRHKVTHDRPAVESLPPETRRVLLELNHLDVQLYRIAERRFAKADAAYSSYAEPVPRT